MTRGLVRKNNLSDLPSAERARINLGLATPDLNRIRGLFTSAGVSNVDVQRIAGATSNYQQQLDLITGTISGVTPELYANRSGDTLTGSWTNEGFIVANTIAVSGVTPTQSSDALWAYSYQEGTFELTASTAIMNSGVSIDALIDYNNLTMASGVVVNKLVPIFINNAQYYFEAG
jgi:hypothetical protein